MPLIAFAIGRTHRARARHDLTVDTIDAPCIIIHELGALTRRAIAGRVREVDRLLEGRESLFVVHRPSPPSIKVSVCARGCCALGGFTREAFIVATERSMTPVTSNVVHAAMIRMLRCGVQSKRAGAMGTLVTCHFLTSAPTRLFRQAKSFCAIPLRAPSPCSTPLREETFRLETTSCSSTRKASRRWSRQSR